MVGPLRSHFGSSCFAASLWRVRGTSKVVCNVVAQVWATSGATAEGVYAKGGNHYTNEAKEAAGGSKGM